jgi:3-oxoacyl-[acyl-carrier protein] reductase
MEAINGKNALITGAGKGLGKVIAIALAQEGVNVGLVGRTEKDLVNLAEELKAYNIKTAIAIADISEMEAVNVAVTKIKGELGVIDILVNNAGVGAFGNFMELDPSKWKEIIDINLMGAYYVTRAVLPEMIDRKIGDIINISSTAGKNGSALTSAYSASKFGLIGMSESLMQEVRKHNIRVTTMLPSTVATDMALNLKLTDGNPDKVMQPEDFAELLIAHLKLNRRVFIKESAIWSTNP